MRVAHTRRFLAAAVALLLAVPGAWLMARGTTVDDSALVARVRTGQFRAIVKTSGELRATKFLRITGPADAQAAQQFQMKISSLVPEGTVVKAGDIVAELDRAAVGARLVEVTTAFQKVQARFEQTALDTSLGLSKARGEIRTLQLGLEERKVAREQARHEAPAVKRRAEIDHE